MQEFIWLLSNEKRINMKKFILLTALISVSTTAFSQKKIIDHTVYNDWKRTEKQQLSSNGNWVTYETVPARGDGYLYIYNVKKQKLDSFFRAKDAKIAWDESFIAFKVTPGFDTLRNCELNKVDKKKWPKDSLFIFNSSNDSVIKIAKLKQFSVAQKGSVLFYLTEDKSFEGTAKKKKKSFLHKKKKSENKEIKSDGTLFYKWTNFESKGHYIKDVTEFSLSEDGKYVAYIRHSKVKSDSFSLSICLVYDEYGIVEFPKMSAYKLPVWNKNTSKIAYLSSSDTNNVKQFDLHVYDLKTKKQRLIGDTLELDFSKELGISEHRTPIFTDNGKYLFFGVNQRVKQEAKDTLLETEKVNVDVWHYLDPQIQPQQLAELKTAKKKNILYVYQLENESIVRLSEDSLDISVDADLEGNYLLASSNERYAIQAQWKSPRLEDYYRVSVLTGAKELISSGIPFAGSLSPSGTYFSYFNPSDKNHYLLNLNTKAKECVTCSANEVVWIEDLNGQPTEAGPLGEYGYTKGETHFFLRSEFDVWAYEIANQSLRPLTERKGEKRNIELELVKWSNDSVYYDLKDCYIKGFDRTTKGSHLFDLYDETGDFGLHSKYKGDFKLLSVSTNANRNAILLRRSTVADYPEVRLFTRQFTDEKVLSNTNPQQSQYNWATTELVKWKAYDGTPLEGILYKPADFDASKKYPLIAYFYELNSENLHNHLAPKSSPSVINPTEYASAGYLVLIPDIRYQAGHPAKSAFNCIVSGTDYIVKNYPVDSTRLGLQGQSWGGYQTAQLITMTNKYAAAMAGAPVGNMFSAYGGIRWGSGLNRQFQYESAQSRIGKTIWEAPELYIENSPLFHLPKVKTPLLMMHNDKDGAVPWYQGIELYNGMRRLGKPCWLLNYNEDDHNLRKDPYKMDLSIRMRQFFDHYLQGKPMPVWMKSGIPAVEKGDKLGYETEEE